ncbi:hypothetical protein [Chryseobacterium koreense]
MKKFILTASLLAVVSTALQCRENENLPTAAEQQPLYKIADSAQVGSSSPYIIWELDPDPPVRDGQDWRQP